MIAEGITLLIKKTPISIICSRVNSCPKIRSIKNSLKPKPLYVTGMKPIMLIKLTKEIIFSMDKFSIFKNVKNILK